MWIVVIFLLLTGCAGPRYIEQTNLILSQQSKRICKEENLKLCGMGGAVKEKLVGVIVHFDAQRKVEIEEARYLIVKCIEELRDALNASEEIREHLLPYPFPTSAMHVGIAFVTKSGDFITYGSVASGKGGVSYVFQVQDKLYYASSNSDTMSLEDYYEEPYEAALEIVKNGSISQVSCEPLLQ